MSIIDTSRRARVRARVDLAKAQEEANLIAEAALRARQKAVDDYLASIDIEDLVYKAAMAGEDYTTIYTVPTDQCQKIPGSGRNTTWKGQHVLQFQAILSGFAKDLLDILSKALAEPNCPPVFLPVIYIEFSNHNDPMNHFMDSVCLLQVCSSTSGVIS